MTVEVFVPLRTRSQPRGPSHWSKRAAQVRDARALVWHYLRSYAAPELPCIVTMIRVAPCALDNDNLRGSLKAARDEVAIWLGLPQSSKGQANDRDPRCHWRYQQGKRGVREYGVIVRAEHVEQSAVDALNAAERWNPLDTPSEL